MKLIINIVITLIGFLVIILEFFVPSAGVIGLIGLALIITGITFTFTTYGLLAGTIFIISCAIIGPVIFVLYFKLFPKSYIGKKLIMNKQLKNSSGFVSGEDISLKEGNTGTSITDLRPTGKIKIDDEFYDATTDGEYINKNQKIKIEKIDGNRIVVTRED